MLKVVVLTDPDTADGFRLAGVEVAVASSSEQAEDALDGLIADDGVGIVAVNERLLPPSGSNARAGMEALSRPIIISLPVGARLEEGEDRRAYLQRLISRMVGFDIALRRE